MIENSVCAVIVSYHPAAEMIEHMFKVLAQVQGMVVVDNGSSAEKLRSLRGAAQILGFHLIENADNLGVAVALNQGVRWAKSSGYTWVILFDQDSCITNNFVNCMLGTWNEHPQKNLIASIQPRYANPLTGKVSTHQRTKQAELLSYMTAGSMMPVWIFDEIGWFASEYFIDYVDFEYCLRARAAGYLIAESRDTILIHAPGETKALRLFGIIPFQASNHSAIRRYYLIRNRVATARKYFRRFPLWTIRDLMYTRKEFIHILIGEENRREKFAAMLKGFIDGIAGRMGKLDAR